MATTTYIDAISSGMWEEMERDPSVFLLGEDIGVHGGAFKATRGFHQHFGGDRVIDTVLSESAILGAAVGAAVVGMRPIAEMQFADFVTCGFNQLVTNAAKIHYRWGVPVPMVVRLPSGGYIHGGPYHSANPEGWFFHVPGLKIVAPSTPMDAKGLMKAAVRDNNPVLFIEYKYLYRRLRDEIPEQEYEIPIGRGEIKRKGDDLAIITYGSTVLTSLEAAERMSQESGVETRVVDLRSLAPLDAELILGTAREVGKLLIVHEDNLTGGVGAEVSAMIADQAFQYLDAPVRRVASLDTPVPFAPTLEEFVLPATQNIFDALTELNQF